MLFLDTETTGTNPHTAKFLMASVIEDDEEPKILYTKDEVESCLHRHDFCFCGHNAKYDAIVINRLTDVMPRVAEDTMLMQYLLHINEPRKLERVYEKYNGGHKEDLLEVYNRTTGSSRKSLPDDWYLQVPKQDLENYALADIKSTRSIFYNLLHEFYNTGFDSLLWWYREIELPVLNILVESEINGVRINTDRLKIIGSQLNEKLDTIHKKLISMSGNPEMNLNSSKQLQAVLYEKLRLPKLKKTKTGASTDTSVLERLSSKHAFPRLLLEYRKLEKLSNTYIEPLATVADKGSRIHTNYNQCLTDTRRFSSDSPNLQNIPSRTKEGQLVKQCFEPKEGHSFLVADFNQVELRILAHFSQDETLLSAFRSGEDVHQKTADKISVAIGREIDRSKGKLLNFSLIYGKSAHGFSWDWNCTKEEAEQVIEKYFEAMPGVRDYIEKAKYSIVSSGGWSKSLCGLPLYIDGANSNTHKEYEHAMRCSVNYGIQSSSQDLLKKVIVKVYNTFGLAPVLMVHDELVWEIPDTEVEDMAPRIVEIMENIHSLTVPLTAEAYIAKCWMKG